MTALRESTKDLEKILKQFSVDEREMVINRLKRFKSAESTENNPVNPLTQQIIGRTFNRQERLQLEMDTLFRYFQRRRELLADALTTTEVAQLLGTSRQTPHDRINNQTLLGVLDKGIYRFPAWQFDPSGSDGVIDGFPEVLQHLKGSDFAKLNWFMRPNPLLDGLTPLDALKQGQKEPVIQEAISIGVIQ